MFVDGKTPANKSVKLGMCTQVNEISSTCHFSGLVREICCLTIKLLTMF